MKDIHENDELEEIAEDTSEDTELEDVEENSNAKIKKLQQKLKQSEQEKMEHLEDLQRAKAEFLNAKRRLDEEKQNDRQRAVIDHVEKLLPMCDSFHMAMSNKEAWENIDATWRRGIESIHNQLQSVLTAYGVTEVSPMGEEFDPNMHEAMTNVPVDTKDMHHKIVSVIQNGFVRTHNGKTQLIRPARVTVGEFSE